MPLAPLDRVLKGLIRFGRLRIIDPDGRQYEFGTEAGPAVTVRFVDRRLKWGLALRV